jgi:hypothetical protein
MMTTTTFILILITTPIGLYVGWNWRRWYMNWRYPRVWLREVDPFSSEKYEERYVMPGNFVWKYQALKENPIFLYEDGTTSQKYTTWRGNLAAFRERN